jgi:activator of HSP90 ATPase
MAKFSDPLTRRQVLIVSASGVGAALVSTGWGSALGAQGGDEIPEKLRTSLHQETKIHATPHVLYGTLLSSERFGKCTGMEAHIDPSEGGAFSMFGGLIKGRNVELVPDARIVQAWRPGHWDAGVYSLVKFELVKEGESTKIVLDHTGFPMGAYASLGEGWGMHYWEPLKMMFR